MKWGPVFGWLHILTLIIAAAVIVAFYFLLRKRNNTVKTIVLFIFSFAGIAAMVYDLLMWNSPLEYLPLHMCAINALLLPIVVITKNKTLGNLLLLWCVGALMALLFTYGQTEYEIFGWTFFFYYVPHIFELGIPILLFVFGMVELDWRCIFSTLVLTIVIYTFVHFCNLAINEYCVVNNILDWKGELVQVNYMYSLEPEISPLPLFWSIIPYSYWYMYATFPIIAVALTIAYLPSIIMKRIKAKKKA